MKSMTPVLLTLLAASLWVASHSAKASELINSQDRGHQSTYGPSLVWPADSVASAGVITSLSENTLPRSGFLEILGSNFGGDGTVIIGGINAPVATWTNTRIIAYVPEGAPLATLPVQVVNGAGASNTTSLTVTTEQVTDDHVNWRFQMNGPYSFVRPAIASDGTVYSIDGRDHLYALTPDGGLKWLVSGAGDKGVAVGPDGTIYVASEDFINAFNPDGSAKWHFVQTPRAFICLGVSVGPDGNVYSVGTHGMGVFSLTPAGALRWTNTELYDRLIVDYAEIVFGPNGSNQQLYFYANDHLRALRLDGSSVFTLGGTFGQPAIGPDGSVHCGVAAYSPNGNLLWSFGGSSGSNSTDVGSDGIHYFGALFALNPNGSLRWNLGLTDYVAGVMVDPQNTQLITRSIDTLDHAGFILSSSAQDGHELWRVILPIEDPTVWNPGVGMYGFNQFVTTRARFTADGQTVYVHTATATGDNNTSKSFVYSLNAGNDTPPPPTPTPTPTATPVATATPTPVATATPMATPAVSGAISYCSNPVPGPVPNVTLNLTGDTTASTLSDRAGNYQFSSLAAGGSYTVTPTKAALAPASAGINTVDVIATQRHFLNIEPLSPGCRLTAADVNGDTSINTVDVIAIQRFFLGLTTGIANTGKYQFTPANRTYPGIVTNQTGQNYDTLVFGDVAGDSVERLEGPLQTAAGDGTSPGEVAATVAAVALPEVAVDQSRTHFIAAVRTSAIDEKSKLVGFQGDFTFDERVVTFQSEPVQKAGITGGNWNVSGNVLPGGGPIRTLRISAYSNDFTPLSGSGTLFELRMTRVGQAAQGTPLLWAAAPDQFIFIDADLKTQTPGNAAPGNVTPSGKRK
jgi:hypothetical protein